MRALLDEKLGGRVVFRRQVGVVRLAHARAFGGIHRELLVDVRPEQPQRGRCARYVRLGLRVPFLDRALEASRMFHREIFEDVEALQAIIEWHETGLLPLGENLCADSRCQFVCSDFFACAREGVGFDATQPERRFDAILVDIDHAPDFHLTPGNASFYSAAGLTDLKSHLAEKGVFGLWSNDPPDNSFTAHLQTVFADARAKRVVFANPYQGNDVTQTIYLAR